MNTYIILRIVVTKDKHPIGIVTLKDFLPSSIFYSSEFFEYIEQVYNTHRLKIIFLNLIPRVQGLSYCTRYNDT
jgi:signal-transduction protein with cAMP-binding, CBS, and nucleotidyltransferase domain